MLTQELFSPEQISASPSSIPLNSAKPSYLEHSLCECEFIEGLPASEAHRRALSARRLLGFAQQQLGLWLIEIDERKLYQEYSCSSVYHYAALHLNLDGHTVAEYIRTGKALKKLPLLSASYKRGEISSSKAREITRVAEPSTDSFWTESARRCSTREIEKMVVYTPKGGLPFKDTRDRKDSVGEGMKSVPASEEGKAEANRTEIKSEGDDAMKAAGESEKWKGNHSEGERASENAKSSLSAEEEKGIKYHDKLIIDLSGTQMAVVKDAFDKARKESGLKDRASLLAYIAKAYMEGGTSPSRKRSKPLYRIVLHHHPASGIAWCESLNGEKYLTGSTLSKALCDAEIIDPSEAESDLRCNDISLLSGCNSRENEVNPATDESNDADIRKKPLPQNNTNAEKESSLHATGENELPEDISLKEGPGISPTVGAVQKPPETVQAQQGTLSSAISFINTLYAGYKGKRKSSCGFEKQDNERWEIQKNVSHKIPERLRREVMLRDENRCQAPGCGRELFPVIHHLIPLAAGGKTIKPNTLVLCSGCHDLVHMGRLSVSGEAPSKLIWRDKEGRVIE